ncbi:YbaB/EbfC family nucleoid-associated protein [Amycolatopsis thermalba]|uniref:YbaB/EbfC family nucleoid-associated protein n=1 Tax=Amycolatopsis thermalba TaxID=944492 RepID=A0ABY4NXB1_9PSEU|nr:MULTISPECIES: YbaB/EbfC family nucleoid-associated protein [Amycolatopsis]UQS24716.1 YbaB/EbfC family nucleoid-associated protein [Amycolatopsis thermalba]
MELPTIDHEARRASYRRLRDDLLEIRARIADVTATADSPDGLISATVAGRGELTELHLDPRLFRSPDSKALAASILDTIRDAVDDSREQITEITREYLPPGAPGRNVPRPPAGGRARPSVGGGESRGNGRRIQ